MKPEVQLIRMRNQFKKLPLPIAATIGNFDGLHRGHREVIDNVLRAAKELNLVPTVITFEPLPHAVLKKGAMRLMSLREKIKLLAVWGIQQVICLHCDPRFLKLSPGEFIENYLVNSFTVRYLTVGENFRFGCAQSGDVTTLQASGQRLNFQVVPLALNKLNGNKISSTSVRQALIQGDCSAIRMLLGRNYSIEQRVNRGAMRGRLVGFPTANLPLKSDRMFFTGVFVTKIHIEEEPREHYAVANVGTRPTIDGKNYVAEAHILDFSGNLYGKRVKIEFLQKIRDEMRFAGLEALKEQIAQDVQFARKYLINLEQ